MSKICDWWYENKWMSPVLTTGGNPSPCRIEHEGITYPALINALMALRVEAWDERKKVSKMQPTASVEWGLGKPAPNDAFRGMYLKHVMRWATPLIAQRFGVVESGIDARYKLELGLKLIATGDAELVWGNILHERFWGACACIQHNDSGSNAVSYFAAKGANMLGKTMVMIRSGLQAGFEGTLNGTKCSYCARYKNIETPGIEAIVFWSEGGIRRYVACEKHVSAVSKYGKRHARSKHIYHFPFDPSKRGKDFYDEEDEEEADWRMYQTAWAMNMGNVNTTWPKSNWNVLTLSLHPGNDMVEHVLESI